MKKTIRTRRCFKARSQEHSEDFAARIMGHTSWIPAFPHLPGFKRVGGHLILFSVTVSLEDYNNVYHIKDL